MRIFSLNADILLKELVALGIQFRVATGKLQMKSNGNLTPKLRAQIEWNRAGLQVLVQDGEHKWRPTGE